MDISDEKKLKKKISKDLDKSVKDLDFFGKMVYLFSKPFLEQAVFDVSEKDPEKIKEMEEFDKKMKDEFEKGNYDKKLYADLKKKYKF